MTMFGQPPHSDVWDKVPRYSKSQVIAAGKLISARNETVTPDLIEAFRVAHDWRAAHLRPMRRVRAELQHLARRIEAPAIVAARLKRLQSVRRKMQRRPMTLFQMQDIAGARAIMRDMTGVDALLSFYRSGRSRYQVGREWDYIAEPKRGGYRSAHLRVSCPATDEDEAYAHLNVEVQVRTRLQHAWATAVEAVGLVRREELKSGQGNPQWLRLFELMSSELAALEGRPIVPNTHAQRRERIQELSDLAFDLDAVRTLENYNQALRAAERVYIQPGQLYIITYDYASQHVSVRTFSRFSRMYAAYLQDEMSDKDSRERNVVSVEVDRVDDLKAAYPNYFMDVRAFTHELKRAVLPEQVSVAAAASSAAATERASKWAHLAFLRDWVEGSKR